MLRHRFGDGGGDGDGDGDGVGDSDGDVGYYLLMRAT